MRTNTTMKLHEVNGAFPPLDESAACAKKLKAALFEGVKEADMTEIMQGLVARAKKGDAKATETLLKFVSQGSPQLSLGIRMPAPGANGHGRNYVRMLDGQLGTADDAVRVEAARLLGTEGPLTASDIAEEVDYPAETIARALTDHEWFEQMPHDKFRLTAFGRKEAIGAEAK